jgi:hypothetical protein
VVGALLGGLAQLRVACRFGSVGGRGLGSSGGLCARMVSRWSVTQEVQHKAPR